MGGLNNISHVYKGLLLRNRAFASYKIDELDLIYDDILNYINQGDWILDPMSGYGGGMTYFGSKGFKTFNIEINPPEYYWQLLMNPRNKEITLNSLNAILERINELPDIPVKYSVNEQLFSQEAIQHIGKLHESLYGITNREDLSIAIILPFVARFANYQRSTSNITHFISGGVCTYEGWKDDYKDYILSLKKLIQQLNYIEYEHVNILGDFVDYDESNRKYDYFVTSPPYPNYRDYSKLFKIENWILENQFNIKTDFNRMIGSNQVRGKNYYNIQSRIANVFLNDLTDKAKKLSKKAQLDIKVYYYRYFALYFYNLELAYHQLDKLLSSKVIGYIVVNDNITRDIPIPVGDTISEIFQTMGYKTANYNEVQISHFGNIRRSAKRINSKHTRHIIKVWKR